MQPGVAKPGMLVTSNNTGYSYKINTFPRLIFKRDHSGDEKAVAVIIAVMGQPIASENEWFTILHPEHGICDVKCWGFARITSPLKGE